MLDQLNQDIKTAMKAGEKEKLSAIRYLKSMLIENQTSKSPIEPMDVVIKHVKKLKDSVAVYPEGNPMKEQILKEIEFLNVYMPKQKSEEEVKKIIQDILAKLGADAQMGMVMKELNPQIKGMFDGKRATELIKEALS